MNEGNYLLVGDLRYNDFTKVLSVTSYYLLMYFRRVCDPEIKVVDFGKSNFVYICNPLRTLRGVDIYSPTVHTTCMGFHWGYPVVRGS